MRVADYIAGHLSRIGVRDVFLLSGGGMMHLIDAVSRTEGITYHCNHHEQACAMAAEAYARLTHQLGVCYATSGPGATNILTGLVGAWIDSAPVLYITGQSNVRQSIRGSGIKGLRQFGTFEVDAVPIMQSVTKYAVFLDDPLKARYHLERAIHLALSGRPGPVLLDVPLNVQGAKIDPATLEGYDPAEDDTRLPASPGADVMRSIVERLEKAERPLILAGHGVRVAGAAALFCSVIDALHIPVVTTQLANDLLAYEHPLFVGHPGVKGDRPGGFAIQNADVILTLGCSLHAQTTGYETNLFAPKAFKIQVDLDDAVLQRENVGVQQKVRSSVTGFLTALRCAMPPTWQGTRFAPWRNRCQDWKERYSILKEPHDFSDGPVNYYEFQHILSELLKGDEAIIADAGSAFYIFGQAFRCKGDQRYIASGGLATMGYTVPACIGAACAEPRKMIIGLTGDGSFHMNVPELQTILHGNFNIKLFVLNNSGYSCIRNTQDTYFGGHHVGTEAESGVSFPSFERIAHAYDIPYIRCEERSHLRESIAKALAASGPVLTEIICQYDQAFLPLLTSEKKEDGTLVAKPIHDLFPFLDRDELKKNMM
ncbi:thiamine pyrophosphate-binding protein [Candidatus Peregrinibacteria bacterium]|nr:thiamine pyrophosphate-binding protein [Candidatus Peregrinibacteria bacterium]